jgi:hypothetical protein
VLVNNISGSKKTVVKRLESKTGSFSYRAAISVRGRPTVYTPEVSVTVKNLRDEVRKLWYGERIAAEQTSQILLDYELSHTYPGLINLTPDYLSNLVDSNWIGQYSSTPDLDSIEPDPTWLYPSIDCELYLNLVQLDISTPLKGRTFALRQGGNYIHITYLNGELYYFPAFC